MDNRKRRRRSRDCLNLPAFNPCLPQNPKGQKITMGDKTHRGQHRCWCGHAVFDGIFWIYIYIYKRHPLIGSHLGLTHSFWLGPNPQLERLTCIHKQVDVWWPESKATMTCKFVEKHTLSFCCGHMGSSFSSMDYTYPTYLNHGEQGTDADTERLQPRWSHHSWLKRLFKSSVLCMTAAKELYIAADNFLREKYLHWISTQEEISDRETRLDEFIKPHVDAWTHTETASIKEGVRRLKSWPLLFTAQNV